MKRKLFCILFATVLAVSLILVPVVASAVTYDSSLTLENKNWGTDWSVKSDGISGTLDYNASGNYFNFSFTATGLTDGGYSLIYYADTEDRYVDWGGDNPGAVIATFTASSGTISSGDVSVNLDMDLPCSPDANAYHYDYTGAPDYYDHATGAKIWLVPTSALTSGDLPVQAWPPTDNWLFETDLIWYDDTDAGDSQVALTADVPDIVAISVNPTSIDFGTVYPGNTASGPNIVVTNVGTQTVDVDASVAYGTVFNNLQLSTGSGWMNRNWPDIITDMAMGGSETLLTQLPVPDDYTPAGPEIATLIFEATAS